MNRIVREHYPVEKLPEDLREGLEGRYVKVTLVTEADSVTLDQLAEDAEELSSNAPLMTLDEIRARLKPTGKTVDEAVADIRAARDEWD